MQIEIVERSHKGCGGGLLPNSEKVPKFSATGISFPSRYVISGTPRGYLNLVDPGAKEVARTLAVRLYPHLICLSPKPGGNPTFHSEACECESCLVLG